MKINQNLRIKLVTVLSDLLSLLCEHNDRFIINQTAITRFHSLQIPKISIKSYLHRIATYSKISDECFVLALIYIDRLNENKKGNFLLNSHNVHRLIITGILVAAKFFDDQHMKNDFFGKVGGISCNEINLLEADFLCMINFNLYVETSVFEDYSKRLLCHDQPSGKDGQQQRIQRTKTKDPVRNPSNVAQASESPTQQMQPVKQPSINSYQSTVRTTPSEAVVTANSQWVKC